MNGDFERALIVLAHPEPRSFNAQMKDVAVECLRARGLEVETSDLHALGFDPVEAPRHFRHRQDANWFRPQAEQRYAFDRESVSPDVEAEIQKIKRADLVIFQYPIWWYGMPAILKGWVDRVFTYGGVYTSQERYDQGRFRGKHALLSVTAGAPEATYEPDGRNANIELVMWPSCFTLYYVGFTVHRPFVSFGVEGGVQYSGAAEMLERLGRHKQAFKERLSKIDAETTMEFNTWKHWNAEGRLRPDAPSFSAFIRHPDSAEVLSARSSTDNSNSPAPKSESFGGMR
jgi:NAD(P)H dehydrogenase (quinone)